MVKFISVFVLVIILALVAGLLYVWFFVLKPVDRSVVKLSRTSIEVDGTVRKYRVFNAREDGPSQPLLVLLHGFKDRSEWISAYSGFNILAQEKGFALLLPEGLKMSWNGGFCCGYSFQNNVDDVGFILKVVEDAKQKYKIDNSKVYVAGFSNGGLLAQKLLVESPDIFRAGASLMSGVGADGGVLDISDARAPIMLVQGDMDKYIRINKSDTPIDGFNFISAEETLLAWQEHYKAELVGEKETDMYKEKTYANNDEVKVLFRMYFGQEHSWPERRVWDFDYRVPEVTRDIWNFWINS
ncbi:MAG: PHB depolymerase family esterase [Candidatus Spechtbacterales bacterium]